MKKIISICFLILLLIGCSQNNNSENEYVAMLNELKMDDYVLKETTEQSKIFPDTKEKLIVLDNNKCKFTMDKPLDEEFFSIKNSSYVLLDLTKQKVSDECIKDYAKLLSHKDLLNENLEYQMMKLLSNKTFDKPLSTYTGQIGEISQYLDSDLRNASVSIISFKTELPTQITTTIYKK